MIYFRLNTLMFFYETESDITEYNKIIRTIIIVAMIVGASETARNSSKDCDCCILY
jgi:hypothetical protein